MKKKSLSKKIIASALFLGLLLTSVSCNGNNQTMEKGEYKKIVATSVATCEILDRLEVDEVVGVPDTKNYVIPKRYKDAYKVGGAMSPDMEAILGLNADLILTPKSLEGELKEKYDNSGVKSYFLNLKSVDGMYESIKELGKMLGKEKQASILIDKYEKKKASIAKDVNGKEKPKVLILMGLPGSYVAATESSYVGDLVKLAGGENIYADGGGKEFLEPNTEDMLNKKPDIIFRTSHAMPKQVRKMFQKEFRENDIWKHFDAVKNNKVYDLDNEYFGMSATFRYDEALDQLDKLLYK